MIMQATILLSSRHLLIVGGVRFDHRTSGVPDTIETAVADDNPKKVLPARKTHQKGESPSSFEKKETAGQPAPCEANRKKCEKCKRRKLLLKEAAKAISRKKPRQPTCEEASEPATTATTARTTTTTTGRPAEMKD